MNTFLCIVAIIGGIYIARVLGFNNLGWVVSVAGLVALVCQPGRKGKR